GRATAAPSHGQLFLAQIALQSEISCVSFGHDDAPLDQDAIVQIEGQLEKVVLDPGRLTIDRLLEYIALAALVGHRLRHVAAARPGLVLGCERAEVGE